MRPIEKMMAHLPKYLRDIITEYRNAEHSGAIHRFWIEAEEVNVPVSDNERLKQYTLQRFGLNDMRMVVKKHRMAWINGELKDVGNEEEGWPFYVST